MQHLLNHPLCVMAAVGFDVLPWQSSLVEAAGDRLVITRPTRKGIKLRVRPGQTYDLLMATPEGLLSLTCSVVDETTGELTLHWPEAPHHRMIQRRNHVRLTLKADCMVAMAPDPLFGQLPDVPARLMDVSEGGCGLEVEEDLLDELPLKVSFCLPQGGLVQFEGKVAHSTTVTPSRRRVGIRFQSSDPRASAALREFVQQRTEQALA